MTCAHCGQPIIQRGWFWVLESEETSRMVTACPSAGHGLHDPVEADE